MNKENINNNDLKLAIGTNAQLINYVAAQLTGLFPASGKNLDMKILDGLLLPTLARLRPILAAVKAFDPSVFNHLNSMQYATFLYLLGNENWKRNGPNSFSDRTFLLNKALNSINL